MHLAAPLQALNPDVGDHLEDNVEKRVLYIYFLTIWNAAIDQGAAIYKETMAHRGGVYSLRLTASR